MLLHGFSGSPRSFDELTRLLSARGSRRVIFRPTLLGHDGGVRRDIRRFDQEIERLARLIARAAPGAHLCGYSLGARVALGLLARHPFLFRGATLIGVNPGLRGNAERALRVGQDERWCQLLLRGGLGAFSRAWAAQGLFASQRQLSASALARQASVRSGHSVAGLAQCLRVLGLGQMPSYWGVLAAPPFDVQLVAGSLDCRFVELARRAAEGSRRVRAELVEGAGHNLVLEAPARLARLLEGALAA